MDERTLALLDDLRRGIDELREGGGDQKRVAELAGVVERRLRADHELHDQDDSLAEDLHEAAVKLEADHPRLAGALRRAVDVLAGMGL